MQVDATHENLARAQVRQTAALQAAKQQADAEKSRQKSTKALQAQQLKARLSHVELACTCVLVIPQKNFWKSCMLLQGPHQHSCSPVTTTAVLTEQDMLHGY